MEETLTAEGPHTARPLLEGAIDCDLHPRAPVTRDLLPYLDAHWAETARNRGVVMRELTSYPPGAPLVRRPDWAEPGESGGSLEQIREHVLDRWDLAAGILTPLFGGAMMHDAFLGAALCAAHNDWIARDWLDAEPRLRSSIVVHLGRPEVAAAEIDRVAADPRFVQVIVPVQTELPLGRSVFKPIFEAAIRNDLPIALHTGSMFRNPPSQAGFHSTFIEDYTAHISTFTAQLANLISEGIFTEYPALRIVLAESGVSWLPAFMWRFSKDWRGVRNEIPWVNENPAELIRRHVRLTAQPFDAPPEAVERIIRQLGSDDMLLFASDYPHWHYDGDAALPEGLPAAQVEKLTRTTPLATYPRLKGLGR